VELGVDLGVDLADLPEDLAGGSIAVLVAGDRLSALGWRCAGGEAFLAGGSTGTVRPAAKTTVSKAIVFLAGGVEWVITMTPVTGKIANMCKVIDPASNFTQRCGGSVCWYCRSTRSFRCRMEKLSS
jgi:hypothetical protein